LQNNGNAINSGRGVVAKNNSGFGAANNSFVNNLYRITILADLLLALEVQAGSSTFSFNNQGNNLASSQCNPNTLNNRQDHSQSRNS
jgi:hypothetical protein